MDFLLAYAKFKNYMGKPKLMTSVLSLGDEETVRELLKLFASLTPCLPPCLRKVPLKGER